jgi:hypothetical protein
MGAFAVFFLLAPSGGADAVRLPNATELREVSFPRHVDSLFGRLGCNAGMCHGSFQGKGGLRLSLFGASPRDDFLALTRDGLGRRVNLADPDQSLLLLKPAGEVPHGGGRRFARNSWEYRLLRRWIAQGAAWDDVPSAVTRLDVQPSEHCFHGPGETLQLAVTATFEDGSRADVTPFCTFRSKDDAVADISPDGVVHGLRPGDTAVIVSYRGSLVTAHALVPVLAGPSRYPNVPEENYIDREVFAKLRRLRMLPAGMASDAEFLRRVTIDTIGRVPEPDEVRAFLADRRQDKRRRKIEELLTHPLHAAVWATKFCDITGNNVDAMADAPELRAKLAKMWHDWLRRRVAENVPYDRIVHGVLCATSRDGLGPLPWLERELALDTAAHTGFETDYAGRPSLDLFWRRAGPMQEFFPIEQMAERTATAFLGVRIECAQCHKHPFDRWTQRDYRAYANVFAQVQFDTSPEVRSAVADLLAERRKPGAAKGRPVPRVREVYVSNHGLRRLADPETDADLPPRALGGPAVDYHGDARDQLFRWLVRSDNPYFARSFVNRVWAVYFGVGLVEPVDNLSLANPPSNARLLDALAADFTAHGYDLRHLERTILRSRTYELSAVPPSADYRDRTNFSHAYPRRLSAEAVVDVLNTALGVSEDFGPDVPRGSRAVEVAPNRVRGAGLEHVFRIFGRPARTATCDCERSAEPAVPQTLFLMTDPHLLKKIRTGRLRRLLDDKRSDEEVLEELFLATVSRFPTDDERQAVRDHLRERRNRENGFEDVLWGLINTREFILNH